MSVRWKYGITKCLDDQEGKEFHFVHEVPLDLDNEDYSLFEGTEEECRLWIQEREYEGGYARSRPRGPDGRVWTSPFQKLVLPKFKDGIELPDLKFKVEDVREPSKKMGWTISERRGCEVKVLPEDFEDQLRRHVLDTPDAATAVNEFVCSLPNMIVKKPGQVVAVMGISGWCKAQVNKDGSAVESQNHYWPLERAPDDRDCWVTTSQINKRVFAIREEETDG